MTRSKRWRSLSKSCHAAGFTLRYRPWEMTRYRFAIRCSRSVSDRRSNWRHGAKQFRFFEFLVLSKKVRFPT
ncbi:hypothetical protein [Nostoc sp.]|uniref:hypothetical protein n=1 Tax=Nostoc sp. TaxID=1180 RepID=UPI002FFADA4B